MARLAIGSLLALCACLSSARVAFWHIPKTGGTSLASGFFRAHGIGLHETGPFKIFTEEPCLDAMARIIASPQDTFFHVHHKDFSFAIALHRKGVQVSPIGHW